MQLNSTKNVKKEVRTASEMEVEGGNWSRILVASTVDPRRASIVEWRQLDHPAASFHDVRRMSTEEV